MRATALDRTPSGWRVRYWTGFPDLAAPAPATRHAFRWSARLASWLFMNGYTQMRGSK